MTVDKAGGVSSEAVSRATGRSWDEWFALLDAENAAALKHPQIAALVKEKFGAPDWWSQTVTVAYEQQRGLRAKYETSGGFSVSRSRTFDRAVDVLFRAWFEAERRELWLPKTPLTIRKATEPKSLRILWSDNASTVDVYFYAKGDSRSQVTVQHSKLADAATVDALGNFWAEALERLKASLMK